MSLGGWWRKVVEVLLSLLSRFPSRGEYIAEADGMRFVAISVVLVFHAVMNLLASRGALGPDWSLKNGELAKMENWSAAWPPYGLASRFSSC